MATIHQHKKIRDFEKFNEQYLADNFYAIAPVFAMIERAKKEPDIVKSSLTLSTDDGLCILCLKISIPGNPEMILLYGDAFDIRNVENVAQNLIVEENKNYFVSGSKRIVTEFLSIKNLSYTVVGDRLTYQCDEVNKLSIIVNGTLAHATLNDLDRLTEMSYQFAKEEYGSRPIDMPDMRNTVIGPGIINRNIYKWVDANQIHSMAQVFLDENNSPTIGLFFTNPESRQKGYGTALLYTLTKQLLSEYEDCGLQSNRDKPISNAVFKKVGYRDFYDWIKVATQ